MSGTDVAISEGKIPFNYDGDQYETWYKIFGDLNSSRLPLIVLHGGPGIAHNYTLPLADLARQAEGGRPVVFYDQIGCGNSTHIATKPSSFWCIELFIQELENVLSFLNIKSFDLYGHSWGSTLATEFIVSRQPSGLRRLILSNGLASSELRNKARRELFAKLPPEVGETVRKHEKAGTTLDPEYKAACDIFYTNHICRLRPVPEEVTYNIIQSQDKQGGGIVLDNMRKNILEHDWTIIDRLHLIKVPTLVINGEYDFMTDEVCGPFFWKLDEVKWVKFASSSHMPQWEERERYMQVLHDFLE